MSGLHEAVARAIRDASHGALGAALPVHNDKRWDDTTRPDCQTCNEAAAAAIRVVRERIEARLEAEASWVDPALRADLRAMLEEGNARVDA